MAGLSKDEETELLILPKPVNFLEQLLEGPSVQIRASFLPSSVAQPLGQLETMQRLFSEPVLLWLPYRVTIQ